MNKIKSIFIGIFPMFSMVAIGTAIYHFTCAGLSFNWVGVIMINLPIMLFISRIMIFKNMARTSKHFPLLTLIAIAGLGLSIYGSIDYQYSPIKDMALAQTNLLAMALSIIGFIGFLLYTFWYSSLDRELNQALRIGKKLLLFSVTDIHGKQIESSSFEGSPTIFIFFRGNWCPLCMAQIKEVALQYQQLSSLGAKVVLCAPQPEKNTQSLANKFDVPFIFVSDLNNQAAQTLGIAMKNGLPAGMEMLGYDKDTVYPTVIITDENGRIIYSDLTDNYRIRPEPSEFIKVLKNHTNSANI